MLLLLIAVAPAYVMAGDHDGDRDRDRDRDHSPDYPPYGSHVTTAHFDHKVRPQLTPPAVTLLTDGTGRVAQSSWNMELLGYDTLDGRSTYQPLVVSQGRRYIAYMAHHAGTAINRLTGLSETNGTSLVDVTDPAHPVYLSHIPGPAGSIDAAGNQMVHVCSGDVLPSNSRAEAQSKRGRYYMLRSNGNSSGAANPGQESHQVFDVTNPSSPVLLTTVVNQLSNTHKSWWECDTGIAYLVANDTSSKVNPGPDFAPGWHQSGSNQHLKIYNLHDPAHPQYIRDFGFVGQQPNVGTTVEGLVTPPTGVHGPISAGRESNRVYMPYGVGGNGVVQILDRRTLLTNCNSPAPCAVSPSEADMLAPQKGFFSLPGLGLQGGHSSFPIFGEENGRPRNILLVSSEAGGNECSAGSAPHALWLYDITNEANPTQISVDANDPALTRLDVPDGFDGTFHVVSNGLAGAAYSGVYPASLTPQDNASNPNGFCNQGGRFGAHAVTELFYPPYYGKLAIASWFAGGVRVWDIRNPDAARAIAYFVPAPNDTGCGSGGGPSPGPGCTFSNSGRDNHTVHGIQTNNVELDDRGYIYIADRAGTGMHILKLTGAARRAVEGDDDDRDHDRGHHDHH
ncbi:MAG: LVIVD repeat-containing protein [Terriglobales bacterium]